MILKTTIDVHPPQTTFIPNFLGKTIMFTNDNTTHIIILDENSNRYIISPGSSVYMALDNEEAFLIVDTADETTFGPFYTRSNSNCIVIKRGENGRLIPVFFFYRF
jgi:hypothetical protein